MSRFGMMAVAGVLLGLAASTAQAQFVYYPSRGYYPYRTWGAWDGWAGWGGYSNVVVSPVVTPAGFVTGSGGCTGQANVGAVTMGFVQTPVYNYGYYLPAASGVLYTTGGGCTGGAAAGVNAQQLNNTLSTINTTLNTMNTTLTSMNTTLTSIDQRLQGIQSDVAKLPRQGIPTPPPNPTEKRDPIPTPPPKPAGAKPESPALAPQPTPAANAAVAAQWDQATERNRTAAAELQALLRQIKTKPSGDQPPPEEAKPGAAKRAAPSEKTAAPG